MRDSVRENPRQTISRRAQELSLSETSLRRILHLDLGMHPYKIQLTQELKINDHRQRRIFADWALEQLEVDPEFGRKIIFSDEAHFWINGNVNKQNCRYWAENNPQEVHQVAMHPAKITVWCLVILGRRHHRAVFFRERRWCGHHGKRRTIQIHDNELFLA